MTGFGFSEGEPCFMYTAILRQQNLKAYFWYTSIVTRAYYSTGVGLAGSLCGVASKAVDE